MLTRSPRLCCVWQVVGCNKASGKTQGSGGGSDVVVLSTAEDGISANDVEGPGNAGSEHETHGVGANIDEFLCDDANNNGENGNGNGGSGASVIGDGGNVHEGSNVDGGSNIHPISSDAGEYDGFFDALEDEVLENHVADNHEDNDDADQDEHDWEVVSNDESGEEAYEYDGIDVEMVTDRGSDDESSEDDGLDAILLPGEIAIIYDDSSYHQAYNNAGGFDIVSDDGDIVSDDGSGNGGYVSGGVDIEMIADNGNVNDGFGADVGSDIELLPDEVAIITDEDSDHEAYGDAEDNDEF